MSRVGPTQLTLAEIAGEAGLTAGALVQRFGSKRGLMVALSAEFAGSADIMFAELRKANPSPLETVRAYSDCMAEMGSSPGALAHHLAYLQVDIADPELRAHLRAHARAARQAIRGLLEESIELGELDAGTDPAALARAVEVTITGSLMTWAIHQDTGAVRWMRDDLEAMLRPHLARTAKRDAASRARMKRA